MGIRKNSKDEDAYDTTSGSQLWFCLPVYWVYILNVVLLSPSGSLVLPKVTRHSINPAAGNPMH